MENTAISDALLLASLCRNVLHTTATTLSFICEVLKYRKGQSLDGSMHGHTSLLPFNGTMLHHGLQYCLHSYKWRGRNH